MTLLCKQHICLISLNNQNRKGTRATGLVAWRKRSLSAGHQEPQPSREAGRLHGKPYKRLEKEKKPIRSRLVGGGSWRKNVTRASDFLSILSPFLTTRSSFLRTKPALREFSGTGSSSWPGPAANYYSRAKGAFLATKSRTLARVITLKASPSAFSRNVNILRKCGNSIRTLSYSGSSAPLSQTTGTLFHSKRRLKRKIILGFPRKINYTYRKINKRFNRRHLSTYLVRRLSIGREYNYRVRKTLLIRNVYKDSVHNISYCNLDQFSKGLLMFLAIHT